MENMERNEIKDMSLSKYTKHTVIHSLAELAKVKYSDSDLYYNYRELAKQNANTFLETIHTKQGLLSAATITFEDGSELILTKEIVAVVHPHKRSY